jgi:hypothetical protein
MRRLPAAEFASDPGSPGWPNEDFACIAPDAAVLLDGCTTVPRDAVTGCVHGVAWYARTLGTGLLAAMTATPRVPLADALAAAIKTVCARHEGTCDLTAPATPAATVTAVRAGPDGISYIVLSDSSIIADYGDGRPPQVITDDHRAARTDPGAAGRAAAGTIPLAGLTGIALLSDGAARLCDVFGLTDWPGLIRIVREDGPAALIGRVRDAEDADPRRERWPRYKARDDATVLYWNFAGTFPESLPMSQPLG